MQRNDNQHSSNMSQLPKVVLVTCGYKDIQQTYKNIYHVISEESSPPMAFNEGIQSSDGTIYCFLDKDSYFTSETVVENVMKMFLQYQEIGAIYTDGIVNGYRQYFPSYSYSSIQNATINTPFFCHKDAQNTVQYYDEALKHMSKSIILHHIPEASFETRK